MLNMFQSFNGFSMFGSSISIYKPYINYTWSNTFQVANKMYSKNIGTAGLNLQQFFGQGCWFNGIDQKLNFETTTSFNNVGSVAFTFKTSSLIKNTYIFSNRVSNNRLYVNWTNGELRLGLSGVFIVVPFSLVVNTIYRVVIDFNNGNCSFIINDFVFKGSYSGLVDEKYFTLNNTEKYTQYTDTYLYKDLYMFNRPLTQAEIEKYTNQPNEFFMDSLEDSSCVLAMPMCEKDGFVRNYKSYSEVKKLIDKTNTVLTSFNNSTRIAQENIGLLIQAGKTYEITYDFLPNVNFVEFKIFIPSTSNNNSQIVVTIPISKFSGKYIFLVPDTYTQTNDSTSCYMWIGVNGTLTTHTFKEISIKEIAGVYPIKNYLETCRTNAQRLSYGLQTSGFKRDSNGLILSKSNFLEADGVGYGDTGYVSPLAVVPESFEFIIEKPKVVQSSFTKYVCGGSSSADMVVEISSSSDTNGYVRLRKVGRAFGSHQWLPTNKMLITLVCDGTNVYVYFNGVLASTYIAQPYTVSNPIKFMGEHGVTNQLVDSRFMNQAGLRLAKIHTKALTQEEVTKNFNAYEKLGLFTESGLPPEPIPTTPQYGIVDEEGKYLVDEDGNFITWE